MPDDYSADIQTAGTVAVGGSTTGELELKYDQDWFAVTLEAGRIYRFDLEGSRTHAGTLSDPYLRGIYDSNGNRIAGTTNDDSGEGYNSRVKFAPDEAGIYYVSAGAFWREEGTYRLSVTDLGTYTYTDPDDFAANPGTEGAVTIEANGVARGEVDYEGDRDWFAVELVAGRTYTFDLEGSGPLIGSIPQYPLASYGVAGSGTLWSPAILGVYDAAGTQIPGTSNDHVNLNGHYYRNPRVVFTATQDGTHYVSAGGSTTGTYQLRVRSDDFGSRPDADALGALTVGGSATGQIETSGTRDTFYFNSDLDWFAVTLQANRTYRFDMEGSATGAGTLRDPYIKGVYNADNRHVGPSDNNGGSGLNSRATFTPTEGGTYYVEAGVAWNTGGGTYTLRATEVTDGIADDYPAGTGTTGRIVVGGSATGNVDFNGDRDWFAVTLQAGRNYRFDLDGLETDAGTLSDPYLRGIYDVAGTPIPGTMDDNGGSGNNSRVTFTATEGGTYYVSAGAGPDSEGAYTLRVTDISVQDDFLPGAGTSAIATGTVAVGGSVTGEIDYGGDRDWFAVTLEAGRTYRFSLEGTATDAGTLYDPYLRGIHDSNGNVIAGTGDNNRGEGRNALVTFTATEDGTHYVSAGAKRNFEGTYRLSVTDLTAEDAQTAGTDTAGTVAVGGSATGEIDYGGDLDWFAVTLEAGRTYRFSLEGTATDAGTLFDPYLRGIHDSNGNVIAGSGDNNRGEGRNALVTFTATETGTHYVSAGAWGDFEGTYRLSVTDLTAADAQTAGTDTAGTVAVDGSATGEIGYGGDLDWFAVTLEAGRTYRFSLEGRATDAGTLFDPYLRGIHDSNGNVIAGTGDNNHGERRNALVTFTATETGTYYVSAGAWGDLEGTYGLSVTDLTARDAHTAGTDTEGTVAVGGSVTGEIGYGGDLDWFAVTLEAGGTYRFSLEGRATDAGTLSDPYLRGIHDSNGNVIAGTDDNNGGEGRNARETFTATGDGIYYVSAGAWSDQEGTYTLSVEEVL